MRTQDFQRTRVSVALAALWLAACGGGGGNDTPVAAAPAPAPVASGPAAPAPAGSTTITGDTPLAVNTAYTVNAPSATAVKLTLPPTAAADATVTVTGVSATSWTIAQNAGQSIATTGLNGNAEPGTVWTPRLAPKVWHWLSSSQTGEVLLAGEAASGKLDTSSDGGETWTTGDSPAGIWISSDMSATGDRMVAVQYQGGMYTSTDLGAHWAPVTAALVDTTAGVLSFESVTMSQDGQRIAAVIQPSQRDAANPNSADLPNGRLVVSTNGGTTWTEPALPGGTARHAWRGIDSSADGATLVAVAEAGEMFLSTDAGVTWSAINVMVAGAAAPVTENWYRVKLSADGQTIAVVANSFGGAPGSGVWVSRNRGAAWTRGFTAIADYTELAMSADGSNIAATASNTVSTTGAITAPGFVVRSTDGGGTFQRLALPGTDTDWRAIAMSADGAKLAVAAGRFNALPAPTTGQLYTSLGNRTSIGTRGSITGIQNASVTLRSLGTGQWVVQSATGGPFVVR